MVNLHDPERLVAQGVGHAHPWVVEVFMRHRLGDGKEVVRLGRIDFLRGTVMHPAVLGVGLEGEVAGLGLDGRQKVDPQQTRRGERAELHRPLLRKDEPAFLVVPIDGRDKPG